MDQIASVVLLIIIALVIIVSDQQLYHLYHQHHCMCPYTATVGANALKFSRCA